MPTQQSVTKTDLLNRSADLLEFDRVLNSLASHAKLPRSRAQALMLHPTSDIEALKLRHTETREARLVIEEHGDLDLAMEFDPTSVLDRVALQAVLTGEELIVVADSIEVSRKAKAAARKLPARAKSLVALSKRIPDLRQLERELRRSIGPGGDVLDSASSHLRSLRSTIRQRYQAAIRSIEKVIESDSTNAALQEQIFTVRSDRLVVPVKSDFRRRIPGIIHGVSDSGATIFVEPFSNVRTTNAWRESIALEGEEILRILRKLSNLVARHITELGEAIAAASDIDFAFMKARYAINIGGRELPVGTADSFRLNGARHPLLSGDIVPISLHLGPHFHCLVITGPNTGGKTVALKTLGLHVLMHQSGLQVPCEPGSTLRLVDGVYADIGDRQNIDESLSTFAAHISNIVSIIRHSSANSLVVIDEIGTSTDAEEGSALGRAILDHFANVGTSTVATTHYRSVASFAEESSLMENASVELDPGSMEPTYRVSMGLPGRSYALEMAKNMGVDAPILREARRHLGPQRQRADALLTAIEAQERQARYKLQEAEDNKSRADGLVAEFESKIAEIQNNQQSILSEYRSRLEAEAKRIQSLLKRSESRAAWEALKEAPPPPRVISGLREEVTDIQRLLKSKIWKSPVNAPHFPNRSKVQKIALGDLVQITQLGFVGNVIALPDKDGKVQVLVGSARVRLDADQLEKLESASISMARADVAVSLPRQTAGSEEWAELDIRGLRLPDAMEKVDHFLDAALVRGSREVLVIHGRGTGVLRQALWRHLSHHGGISDFEIAGRERGGDGATVIRIGD